MTALDEQTARNIARAARDASDEQLRDLVRALAEMVARLNHEHEPYWLDKQRSGTYCICGYKISNGEGAA